MVWARNGTGTKWDSRARIGTGTKWDGHEMAGHEMAGTKWFGTKWPGTKWDIPIYPIRLESIYNNKDML